MGEYYNKEYYNKIKGNCAYIDLSPDNIKLVMRALYDNGIPFSASYGGYRNTITVHNDDKQRALEIANANRGVNKANQRVIGNTEYKSIKDRHYINTSAEIAMQVSAILSGDSSIKFSGVIKGDNATLTVSGAKNAEMVNRIIDNVRNADILNEFAQAGFERMPDSNNFIVIRNVSTGETAGFKNMAMVRNMWNDRSNEFFHAPVYAVDKAAENAEPFYISDTDGFEEIGVYVDENGTAPTFPTEEAAEQYAESNNIPLTQPDVPVEHLETVPENAFEYGGYHFVPVDGQAVDFNADDFKTATRNLRHNTGIDLSVYSGKYDYAEFYKASGGSSANLFKCVETGGIYVPGDNELFEYTGEIRYSRQIAVEKPEARRDGTIDINRDLIDSFDHSDSNYANVFTYDDREEAYSWIVFDDSVGEDGVLIEKSFTEEDVFEAYKARISAENEAAARDAFISVLNERTEEVRYSVNDPEFTECAEKYIHLPVRGEAMSAFAIYEGSKSAFNVEKFIEFAEKNCAAVREDKARRESENAKNAVVDACYNKLREAIFDNEEVKNTIVNSSEKKSLAAALSVMEKEAMSIFNEDVYGNVAFYADFFGKEKSDRRNELEAYINKNVSDLITAKKALAKVEGESRGKTKTANTNAHKIFRQLSERYPEIMSKAHSYEHYESSSFEPLSIEWIGNNSISIMQTFTQNGDMMRDPDIVLRIDTENGTANAVSFENSGAGIYEEYSDGSKGQKDTNSFMLTWLKNLEHQHHYITRATAPHPFNGDTYDIEIKYKDGKIMSVDSYNGAEQDYLQKNGIELYVPVPITEIGTPWELKNGDIISYEGRAWTVDNTDFDGTKMIYITANDDSGDDHAFYNDEIVSLLEKGGFRFTNIERPEESPIHFGLLGNGITVYDTSREVNHDYPTVAHISDEGIITYYDRKNINESDIRLIEEAAAEEKQRFTEKWNKLSILQKFQRILDAATAEQSIEISRLDISSGNIVNEFEHSIIFRDEPYPDIAKLKEKYADGQSRDNSAHSQETTEQTEAAPEFREVPLYTMSFAEAEAEDKTYLYRTSAKENRDCAHALDNYIEKFYNNNSLDTDAVLNAIFAEFPEDRVEFVIAANIAGKNWDARFRHENLEWAENLMNLFSDDFRKESTRYALTAHAGLVDLMGTAVHKYMEQLRESEKAENRTEKTLSLREQLINNVNAELADFLANPGDASEYHINMKKDIADFISGIEDDELSDKQYETLLSRPHVLAELYEEWLAVDIDEWEEDDMMDFISDTADSIAKSNEVSALERAKAYISEYISNEFDVKADFTDLHSVSLGYTELGDNNEYPFRAEADLLNFEIRYWLADEMIANEVYDSIEDMEDKALSQLDFNDIMSVGNNVLDERNPDEVSKALDLYRNHTTFCVVNIEDEKPIVMSNTNVYSDDVRELDEYREYIRKTGKHFADVTVTYYDIGNDEGNTAYPAEDGEVKYIQENLDAVLNHSSTITLEKEKVTIYTSDELLAEYAAEQNVPAVGNTISAETAKLMWECGFDVLADGKFIGRYDVRNYENVMKDSEIFGKENITFSAEESDIEAANLIDTVAEIAMDFNADYYNIDEAIEWNEWIESTPSDPYNLIKNALAIGDFQRVEEYFDEVLNYINIDEDMRKWDRANEAFEKLRGILPQYLGATTNTAYYYVPKFFSVNDLWRIREKRNEYVIGTIRNTARTHLKTLFFCPITAVLKRRTFTTLYCRLS